MEAECKEARSGIDAVDVMGIVSVILFTVWSVVCGFSMYLP